MNAKMLNKYKYNLALGESELKIFQFQDKYTNV